MERLESSGTYVLNCFLFHIYINRHQYWLHALFHLSFHNVVAFLALVKQILAAESIWVMSAVWMLKVCPLFYSQQSLPTIRECHFMAQSKWCLHGWEFESFYSMLFVMMAISFCLGMKLEKKFSKKDSLREFGVNYTRWVFWRILPLDITYWIYTNLILNDTTIFFIVDKVVYIDKNRRYFVFHSYPRL